ncbi:prefoldin subunit beta [Candidatus Pacearchaeota archaeon]|nr:prefoldin subunit beta [Candidatus Pacearchaeota archaeon]
MDKETQEKIQELQAIEQNLQSILMQKQAFQMELGETDNAITEIAKSNDDIYKLVGQIMIKAKKDEIQSDLEKKQDLLNLRLKSLEKQEESFSKQSEEIRAEVMKKVK